jgi:hypothetical protein
MIELSEPERAALNMVSIAAHSPATVFRLLTLASASWLLGAASREASVGFLATAERNLSPHQSLGGRLEIQVQNIE